MSRLHRVRIRQPLRIGIILGKKGNLSLNGQDCRPKKFTNCLAHKLFVKMLIREKAQMMEDLVVWFEKGTLVVREIKCKMLDGLKGEGSVFRISDLFTGDVSRGEGSVFRGLPNQ
nr:hypothetical protein Itr_chr08CG17560 [Ipomoea trifida]